MNDDVRNLEPKIVWNYFADLNAIPRASKKEAQVIAFMQSFAKQLNLPCKTDDVGNVLISKPATKNAQHQVPVILQGHLDMVHQKNSDSNFNFDTQGIEMYVDGDFVKAKGTTLGADNGLGVASIMALLASTDIPHPALEALFTIDEETGMTGALALQPNWMKGKILLNLDTEDDDELTIGCAGGIDVTTDATYPEVDSIGSAAVLLSLKGLTGGHSGVDIHKNRANANKLLAQGLWELQHAFNFELASFDGGGLRNAIPREAKAKLVLPADKKNEFLKALNHLKTTWQDNFKETDPSLTLEITETEMPKKVCNKLFTEKVLTCLVKCPNGVYKMSEQINNLVETSNNVARIKIEDGHFLAQCLTRSSVETQKDELVNLITNCFKSLNGSTVTGGNYPGWEPQPNAPIVKIMEKLYEETFGSKAKVNAIHAGLECGIIGANYPDVQMISFGPNIFGAHSPDERAQISSFQKFWKYLQLVLEKIPEN